MSEIDITPPRPKRRILFRLIRGFLVFVVLLIATYLIADQILLRKVQRQREAFKERFGAVDFRDFIPVRPAPEEDAGRVYRYAAGLMAKVDQEYGDWSMYDALTKGPQAFDTRGRGEEPLPTQEEVDVKVREKMAAMHDAFRVAEQARALVRGSLVLNFEFDDKQPDELKEVRRLARNLAAKAVFEAQAGNLDIACAWLESGVHLASTIEEEPALMVQLVRMGIIRYAADAAEQVFDATDVPLPLSDRYWALLDGASDPAIYRRALASDSRWVWSQEIPTLRLIWSANESKMLDFYSALDSVLRLEARSERRKQLDAFPREQAGPMLPTNFMLPMMAPPILGGVDGYDRMNAQCDFVRIAATLRSWKQGHGAYPDSLDELVSTEPLPLDPFSGEAYRYRREGDGFVLYSVGLNRKDDSGVKGENRDEGDIVWTCVR